MPSSVNLRKGQVPKNSILFWENTVATIPPCYTHATALHTKLLRNVPNACTNPGTTGGASSHTHSGTCHGHTFSGGGCHSHAPSISACASAAATNVLVSGGVNDIQATHQHGSGCITVGCASECVAVSNASHSHSGSGTNAVDDLTIAPIKKNSNVNIRKSSVPFNAELLWACTLASIPTELSNVTTNLARYFKGIPCSCTNPGTTSCAAANHTHSGCAAHVHGTSGASHNHSVSGTWGQASPNYQAGGSATNPFSPSTHTHGAGSMNNASESGCIASSGDHTHAAQDQSDVVNVTLARIKQTSISMRKKEVPKKSIVLWEDTLASIPTTWNLTDGTNCTPNYLAKTPKGIPTACTNPGVTGGSDTHSETSACHSHTTFTLTHTHTGTSGSAPCAVYECNGSGNHAAVNHTHATSYAAPACALTVSTDAHTHAAANHHPPYVEVAYIQKL